MTQDSFQETNRPTDRGGGTQRGFWMRSIRFSGLHRVLHLVASYQDGIRAGELNREIIVRNLYRTARGTPAKSTLYHCRNTLLQLGAIERAGRRLFPVTNNPAVVALLQEPPPIGEELSQTAKDSFAVLVLSNDDCLRNFFRLFVPNAPILPPQFRARAQPVVWLQPSSTSGSRRVELRSTAGTESIALTSPIEIQSILYGVRYWATDELELIDEFFETARGSVMYPIRVYGQADAAVTVMERILGPPRDPGDWTTVSVNALLRTICEAGGYSVTALFDGIRRLTTQHPGHVVLIPTIPNIAAISARSHHREAFELRGYFTDSRGRIISHIRFHNSL